MTYLDIPLGFVAIIFRTVRKRLKTSFFNEIMAFFCITKLRKRPLSNLVTLTSKCNISKFVLIKIVFLTFFEKGYCPILFP